MNASSLSALRQRLHQQPELSGQEAETAALIREFFEPLAPDEVLTGLGGTGLAFVFGQQPGPSLLLRCELDALPIQETGSHAYRSQRCGVGHQCGHDGHMAILAAVGQALSNQPPTRGQVTLLFQPAEETGTGAAAVAQDDRFQALNPDFVFALHNMPGFPLGQIVVREGPMTCASRGVSISLSGRTAHAAQPETGCSPARALAELIDLLNTLATIANTGEEIAFATVVGARLGGKAFGTAPGDAELWATLRSETDHGMSVMLEQITGALERRCAEDGLSYQLNFEDVFPATRNHPEAVQLLTAACSNLDLVFPQEPIRWSEDVGHLFAGSKGALFGLGAGAGTAALHDPEYDFPDALIEHGRDIFLRLISAVLED